MIHREKIGSAFVRKARSLGTAVLMGLAFALPSGHAAAQPAPSEIMANYADIAHAMYDDATIAARALLGTVDQLLAAPTAENLAAARHAWTVARRPYQMTEGFRYGNPIVDGWEGRVNAWPLDEGFIDYVADGYSASADENPAAGMNIIANKQLRLGPKKIDAATITPELLSSLHEAFNIEANVATGYHAIEFLLWGQDLNGTGPGAGNRPATDFDPTRCTGGNCGRRADYLRAAVQLLVSDLEEITNEWRPRGPARTALAAKPTNAQLGTILTGIGLLSYGELAGERIRLGLVLHDPEEEHDCFSDNTHNAHFDNQLGMMAIYQGRYERLDGTIIQGPSLEDYGVLIKPDELKALTTGMRAAHDALAAIKQAVESGAMAYDQMLAEGNVEGNQLLQNAIDALVRQANCVWKVAESLNLAIEIEGSEMLEN